MMKHEERLRRYYESKLEEIDTVPPPARLTASILNEPGRHRRLGWEDLLGALVTAGYLLQVLLPGQWFSFGRFLFNFRFGF